MAVTNYADSGTPVSTRLRSRMAEALLSQGMSAAPVQHWTQGLARMAQALVGGMGLNRIEGEEQARRANMSQVVQSLLGGDTGATPAGAGLPAPGLTRVPSSAGAAPAVSSAAAPQFSQLIGGLENEGITVDPSQTSGYANRNIAGTNVPSMHASGRAVDINSRDNPQGPVPVESSDTWRQLLNNQLGGTIGVEPQPVTTIPPSVARDLAARTGMRWGGDFQNAPGGPDPMHFEVAGQPQAPAPAAAAPSGGLNLSPQARAAVAAMARINPQAALQMVLPLVAKADQPTDKQRNYAAYVRDQVARGEPYESFRNWDLEGRRAGATAITSQITGERQQDKDLGAARAKTEIEIRNAADKAYETLGRINLQRQQMNDPNFYSGTGGNLVLNLKRAIAAVGGNPDAVSSMETFQSQGNQLVLQALGGGLGAQISNSDRDYIQATAASLDKSPEGNRKLLNILERLERRKIEAAEFMDQYVADHGRVDAGFSPALRRWRDAHPMFTEDERSAAQGGGSNEPAASGKVRRYNPSTGQLE